MRIKIKLTTIFVALVLLLTSCIATVENSNNSLPLQEETDALATLSPIPNYDESSNVESEDPSSETEKFSADIDSRFAIVYNATEDRVLFEKDADERCYPASLTKLMTAIIALENLNAGEIFTVGTELSMVNKGSSLSFIAKGHKLTLRMLIEALLLPSGNDAAYTIAVNTYKKIKSNENLSDKAAIEGFCGLMNAKSKEIGALSTNFVNPDGWHDEEHYTTARDMLLISEYASKIPLIAEIASIEQVKEIFVSGEIITWTNTNALIVKSDESRENEFYNVYAKGLKTGSTPEAGYCLSSYAEANGSCIFTIVLGANANKNRFEDANKLFNLAFSYE